MTRGLVWGLLLVASFVAPTFGATKVNLPSLVETLTKGTNTAARMEVAKKLGQSGNTQAVAPLIKALDDANRPVRWAAIEALGELRKKDAVPGLLKYLERQEAYRWGNILTVNALAAINDRRAVQSLVALLENNADPILQRVVILALGKLGDAKVIPTVMPFLKDERRWLRRAAQVALVQLTRDRLRGRVPRGYEAWAKWYNNAGKRSTVRKRN
jgi:HEAT repeat protein